MNLGPSAMSVVEILLRVPPRDFRDKDDFLLQLQGGHLSQEGLRTCFTVGEGERNLPAPAAFLRAEVPWLQVACPEPLSDKSQLLGKALLAGPHCLLQPHLELLPPGWRLLAVP